jgi:hypothetical protein
MNAFTRIIECRPGKLGGNWHFYCGYCKRDHVHGAGEGHRTSHCKAPESPYCEEDIYIVLHGTDWPERYKRGELVGRPWVP